MNHIYAKRTRVTLLVLMLLAIMTGCSGPKPEETQSGLVEPATPEPVATETPDPVVEKKDTNTLEDFKVKVRTCVDQLLDDDTVLSLLYSQFYQGYDSGYGGWFNDNVNYTDLMSFWPLGRGAEASKEQLCQGGIKQSLTALAGLADSGRFSPFEISNFVGDMGLAVSNQGRLSDVYNRIGKVFAKPLGQGWWNLGVPGGGNVVNNFLTHVSSSNDSILGQVRNRNYTRVGNTTPDGQTAKVGPGKGDYNLPLPKGIFRQVRAVMATVRDENGITQELHESAHSALTKRNFAH